MMEEAEEFKRLVNSCERIFITSHISPDPDALSSLLLTGHGLKLNYPEKEIFMALEEKPDDLSFIVGFNDVHFGRVLDSLKSFNPDLFILLDGNNYERCSRHDGQSVRDFILSRGIKTIVIDHHEKAGMDKVDLYINRNHPASAQTVYQLLFNDLKLKKFNGAAQTAMIGFYADTGGFVYLKDGDQGKMFTFAEELVSDGANIENVKFQLFRFKESDLIALSELLNNVTHGQDYTFSYIGDDFINSWLKERSQAELQTATGTFLDMFVRNVDGRTWGFIVYKNTLQGPDIYSVSFRAQNGIKDVSFLANKLGGGGHKAASGAKFAAKSVEEAIKTVETVIKNGAVTGT